jgi:hypothetical protein
MKWRFKKATHGNIMVGQENIKCPFCNVKLTSTTYHETAKNRKRKREREREREKK